MKLARNTFVVAGLLVAVACGSNTNQPDAYQAAVPTFDGVSLEVSGASSEGSTLTADGSASQTQALTGAADWLPAIRDAIRSLNQGMKDAFGPVEQLVLTQGPSQVRGQVQIYGPFDKDGFSYLLSVVRVAGNHYAWKLQVKKTSDQDAAYVAFAAGTTFKATGDNAHRGRGSIGVDADAYKTVNTGFPGQGKLFVAFSHHGGQNAGPDGGVDGGSKTLFYALKNFSADTTQWQPVDAVFYGHKNGASGVTSVRVVSYADIPSVPNDTPAKELLLGRARFNPGVGGRAEIAVLGGDLGDQIFFGAECWDRAEMLTFKATALCNPGEVPGTGSCMWTTTGDEAACDVRLATGERDHVEPSDKDRIDPDSDAPANDVPALPSVMPDGAS
jgi:hypothetical protein